MINTRRVGVFITNAHAMGQQVMEGISTYCQRKRGWKLSIAFGDYKEVFRHLADHADGIIAGIDNDEFVSALRAWGKPYLNVFPGYTPSVYSDPCAIAKTGAEHLIGLGCKRFAFCCFKNSEASQSYRQAFEQAVQQVGGQCHVHEVDTTTLNWPSIWKAVSDWVAALPKPIGLMAVKDSLALEVLEACGDLGIRVPEQIAVVGMGNDKLLCERADPRLSSVDPGNARIGFKAAMMLEEMMSGKSLAQQIFLCPPLGVVGRASTGTQAVDDPQMNKALIYIQEHACDPMQVNDLLSVVPLSRRSMEVRFTKALGRSPHEEIRRIQIQRVIRLLSQTHLPQDQVARASGFRSPTMMIKAFRKELGVTPGEYRRRCFGTVPMAARA